MKLDHNNHYENILLFGECGCGASKYEAMTFSELVKESQLRKLLSNYPDIRLGKKLDELTASTPF